MSWQIEFRPEVEQDVAEAAEWYEAREPGLGVVFIQEVIRVWERFVFDPINGSRRSPSGQIRWLYPKRFPYRIIYHVDDSAGVVLVIAVLHAARHDRHWQQRRGPE